MTGCPLQRSTWMPGVLASVGEDVRRAGSSMFLSHSYRVQAQSVIREMHELSWATALGRLVGGMSGPFEDPL